MDGERFDRLIRTLTTQASRRGAIASLLAGLLAAVAPEADPEAARRHRHGKPQRDRRDRRQHLHDQDKKGTKKKAKKPKCVGADGSCKKPKKGKTPKCCGGLTCDPATKRCVGSDSGGTGDPAPPPGRCSVGTSGAVSHVTEAGFQGQTLRLEQTVEPFGPARETAARTALTLNGAPLLTLETTGAGGSVTVTVTYGGAFAGIRQAQFTNDGTTVQGEIDGRVTEPLPADGDPQQLRFADGAPPPQVQIDPELAAAIQSIMRQAQQEASGCQPTAPAGSRAAANAREGRVEAASDPTQSPECLLLYIPCQIGMVTCQYGVGTGCVAALFGYGACVAIGMIVCLVATERCRRGIRHNAPCCPVQCGGDPENLVFGEDPGCCERGETCLNADDSESTCCAPGTRPCGGRNCCAGQEQCHEAEGLCCAPNFSPCQGVCCPSGSCQEDGCCSLPNKVCGATCCPPFTQSCCNGRCCDGECVNNVCCKAPNVRCGTTCCGNNCCNNVCCALGESCSPTTGACARICNTNLDQWPCPNQPGMPVCCPGNTSCCQNGECCLAGWDCCPGSDEGCCPPGQECCQFGSTSFCSTTCIR